MNYNPSLYGFEHDLINRLDKIIRLLETRNSELLGGQSVSEQSLAMPECTCHKKGKTSAVETCQLHG